jgi:multidrug efflux pump subunit AcrB
MKKVIATLITYRFYSRIIIVFLIIAGSMGFMQLKKSFFPDQSIREMTISVVYPGASPREMEEGVITRIEDAIKGIPGLKHVTSVCNENVASMLIIISRNAHIDEVLAEVKNAVDAISSFPKGAEKPVVAKIKAITPALRLGLFGDVDLLTLKQHAQRIKDDFLASGAVSQVTIEGFPPLEISIEVSEANLLRYQLTFDDIANAVKQDNLDISSGIIKSHREEILIRSSGRKVDPDAIADIIVKALDNGNHLRIRDVGTVKLMFADQPGKLEVNSKQAALLHISKLAAEDLDAIAAYCKDYIKRFNDGDFGVNLEVTYDYPGIFDTRLNMLIKNGVWGFVLVVTILGFFLSFRLSLWVAWSIPASFLGMALIGQYFGITINMVSLSGMILVVGILVDDGIVIGENIFTHRSLGKNPKQAALDGTIEVMPAIFTSVFTTIVAFAPLLFLEGKMEYLYEMAIVIVMCLSVSLMDAFFVLPAHVVNPIPSKAKKKTVFFSWRETFEKWGDVLRKGIYGKLLKNIFRLKWLYLTVPIAILLIFIGLFRGGVIKYTYLPFFPFNSFTIDIAFKPGSVEQKTYTYLKRFDNVVWQVNKDLMKEFNTDQSFVDFTVLKLGTAFYGQEKGFHAGHVAVSLKELDKYGISVFQVKSIVEKAIGKVPEARKCSIGGINIWGKPISVSILGRDPKVLEKAGVFMMQEMQKISLLSNITSNDAIGKREIQLTLKPRAYFLGLNRSQLNRQVRQGFYGELIQRLQVRDSEIKVWGRYPGSGRFSLGQLETMKIKTPQGEYPLSELATYTISRGPVSIQHYNGSREVRVEAELVNPYEPVPPILNQISRDIIPRLKVRFPGINVLHQGQQRDKDEAQADLIHHFGIAFAVIVLILTIHFKSFSHPLLVIAMIPFAWIGSALGHAWEGQPVSIISVWGMVALSGIIINDGVVFLSKYNDNLRAGVSVVEAIYDAGISRFRPIILTSLTTAAGLYPIVLETSPQAAYIKPMAISLAYGVLIGTPFLLIFLPIFILVLNQVKVALKWLWTGTKPNDRSVENAVINLQLKREPLG